MIRPNQDGPVEGSPPAPLSVPPDGPQDTVHIEKANQSGHAEQTPPGSPQAIPVTPNREDGAMDAAVDASIDTSADLASPHTPRYIQTEAGELKKLDAEPQESPQQWQEMDVVGSSEMYDDRNKLVQRVEERETLESHDAAAAGYTRVWVDDDNESINSLDERTDHLFDAAEDSTQQMASTKEMLDGEQRLAYAGLCRVIAARRGAELRIYSPKQAPVDSYLIWERGVMRLIYTHLEVTPEEQIMIEQLPTHGVLSSDLTPSLKRTNNSLSDLHEETKATQVTAETIDVKWTVLCDLFLNLVSHGTYDARSRYLLELVSRNLDVSALEMAQFERKVTDAMQIDDNSQQTWTEDEIIEDRRKGALRRKYAYIGAATIGGGLVIGLSAGLLAPVIGAGLAAGFTTIGITGTGTFLAGAGGAATIASTGAAIGARVGSKGMMRRMGHVKTFEFRPVHNNNRVNVIVSISGWMNGTEDDVRLPYSTVDPLMGDLLSVYWEPEMMQSMGQTINILATEALTQSIQQILGATILTGLMASLQLPMALSKLSYLLDNPWNVSLDRAWNAGLILADTLRARNLGNRPVTLVGFSLGARVIYSALVELAKRGDAGIVQDVYLFGTPVTFNKKQFCGARSIVAGKFVNGYSTKDWVLGYLFRATSGGFSQVLGLSEAKLDGFEDELIDNFDCTSLVEGHMGYRRAMPKLLKQCGWQVVSEEFDEIEDPDPDKLREKQRKLIEELNDDGPKKKNRFSSFFGFGGKQKASDEWISAAKADSDVFNVSAIKEEVERLEKNEIEMIFDDGELDCDDESAAIGTTKGAASISEHMDDAESRASRASTPDEPEPPAARQKISKMPPTVDTLNTTKPFVYHSGQSTPRSATPAASTEPPAESKTRITMSFE